MKPIRVLLVEDHGLVRAGIRALLERIPGVKVIAEASNGREGLSSIKIHQPEVALLDIVLPNLNGLEIAERVTKQFPNVGVIMLSMHANEEYVWRALRAGARGYVVKDAGPAELELAIRAVQEGKTYLSPVVSKTVVEDYMRRVSGPNLLDGLSPRQREILQLIAEGHSTKEIALQLDLSAKTVETHRAQLMERLGIHDVAGLVRYAIRSGLLSPEG